MAEKEFQKSMTEMIKISFLPSGKEGLIEKGETLYQAAIRAKADINALCGGNSSCGKCKVTLFPEGREVLACTFIPHHDIYVKTFKDDFTIKNEHLPEQKAKLISPLFKAIHLKLSPPTLHDTRDDFRRVTESIEDILSKKYKFRADIELLRNLPSVLRENKWNITVIFLETDDELFISRIGADDNCCVAVIDFGTTSVHLSAVNLKTGKESLRLSRLNGQVLYGADIITRIRNFSIYKKEILQSSAETIDSLLKECAKKISIGGIVISANTTMDHILLGLNPEYIRLEPNIPLISHIPPIHSKEYGVETESWTLFLPSISAYVGGDIVAGIIACGMTERETPSLLVDLGTNGEIALASSDFILVTSASAGPAFEGGAIKCGMRAADGAIDRVWSENGKISFSVIGDKEPQGICGSALISLIAILYRKGIINGKGHFTDRERFVLTKTQDGEIFIDDGDIENLMRAKAAIYAASEFLIESAELTFNDLEKLYLAGSISYAINIEDAITIGLLPDIARNKIIRSGNTSLTGGIMITRNSMLRKKAEEIAVNSANIDLSQESAFHDKWSAALFIPHTDLQKFPSLTGRRQK